MGVLREKKKIIFVSLFCIFPLVFLSAHTPVSLGCAAYANEDWESAVLFFKKAQALGELTDETLYLLVHCEVQLGDFKGAQADCGRFLDAYDSSPYFPHIMYQNGKLLHQLGRNESAVLYLCEFCRRNPDSFLYGNALYFMAESFFCEYNFDAAKPLYEKIVCDFPQNENIQDAKYKIMLIENRAREEKLLYLLKVIGEESLASQEEYDRKLRSFKLRNEASIKVQGR